MMTFNEVLEAVARGWCSPDNSGKEMDAVLARAIANEVWEAMQSNHRINEAAKSLTRLTP